MESESHLAIGATRYAAWRAFIPIIEVRRRIHSSGASLYIDPYALVVIDEDRVFLYPFLDNISFESLKVTVPGLLNCIQDARNQLRDGCS